MNKLILLFVLFIFIIGCSRDNDIVEINNKPRQYIIGKFGNEDLEFLYNIDELSNYYIVKNDPLSNELRIIMNSNPNSNELNYVMLSIKRINLNNIRFPWIPKSVSYPSPYSSVTLYDNITKNYYTGNQLLKDNIYIQINAITGDTIEGIFNGDIKSDQTNVLQIKKGQFRVKFNRINL